MKVTLPDWLEKKEDWWVSLKQDRWRCKRLKSPNFGGNAGLFLISSLKEAERFSATFTKHVGYLLCYQPTLGFVSWGELDRTNYKNPSMFRKYFHDEGLFMWYRYLHSQTWESPHFGNETFDTKKIYHQRFLHFFCITPKRPKRTTCPCLQDPSAVRRWPWCSFWFGYVAKCKRLASGSGLGGGSLTSNQQQFEVHKQWTWRGQMKNLVRCEEDLQKHKP